MSASDDVAQLKAAIASGALSVRYADGRQVTYRSLAEMREILRMLQEDAAPAPVCRSFVVGF